MFTAWDFGIRDTTTIIFFEMDDSALYLVNIYKQSAVGLKHFIKHLESLPYHYQGHIIPHDINIKKTYKMGIDFCIAPWHYPYPKKEVPIVIKAKGEKAEQIQNGWEQMNNNVKAYCMDLIFKKPKE